MSENKAKHRVKHSESASLSSEDETTLNLSSDHPSSGSENQSSFQNDQPYAVSIAPGKETDLPDSASAASPSRLSFKKRVSNYIQKFSPKKEADMTQSPQKSGLSVTSAVGSILINMSDSETRSNVKHFESASLSSEKEATLNNMVSDHPSPRRGQSHVVAGAADTKTDLQDSTLTSAGETNPSRLSFKKKVSSYIKNLSPKKENDQTQSPQKSGPSVTSAVGGLVSGAIDLIRKSPEKTSLIDTDYGCTPPLKATKEFYCKIDTFVDREGEPKTCGNSTATTSLDTSSEITSPSDDAGKTPETSPTEEAPLLPPDQLLKGLFPKKDNLPRNN